MSISKVLDHISRAFLLSMRTYTIIFLRLSRGVTTVRQRLFFEAFCAGHADLLCIIISRLQLAALGLTKCEGICTVSSSTLRGTTLEEVRQSVRQWLRRVLAIPVMALGSACEMESIKMKRNQGFYWWFVD